jgi:glycerol-3-phosphate cytidylyltransferase-like family protein
LLARRAKKVSTPMTNLPKMVKSKKIVAKVVQEENTVIKSNNIQKKTVKIVLLVDTLILLELIN